MGPDTSRPPDSVDALAVTAVPAFADNYLWLIHGVRGADRVAVVDPGDATPVLKVLA